MAVQSGLDEVRYLRALFDQTPGFTAFLRGPTHIFELTNPGYQRLIAGRAVLGQPIRAVMPELEGQGYFELLDRVFAAGEPFVGRGMKVGLSDNDGIPYDAFVDFVYQPILGSDGAPVGILVQGIDVTQDKLARLRQQFVSQAAEAIASIPEIERALSEVAQAAVETLADLVLLDFLDGPQGRRPVALVASPLDQDKATALLAWPLPAPVPSNHVFHQSQGTANIVADFTPQMMRDSARGPEHEALLTSIGFHSSAFIPLWHRGHLYGLLSLITTKRSGRRFDSSYIAALTQVGRLASTALENARLTREREAAFAAEKMARQSAEGANRAKDDFLAMLGHELRNPLAPILTAVQLMRARGENESYREQQIIERQAQHLVRIVDDLLDVSRIVHGKLELRREPLDLAMVGAKAIETAMPSIEKRGHQLVTSFAPDLAVLGDETRLCQLVVNLLTNAARYTPPNGRIELSIARDGEGAVIYVRDNGVGIPPEMLPTVFDMFVQAPQSVDRATGGLGVGLTLVREIAQLHGGSVSARNMAEGTGSEFCVRLPLLDGALADNRTRKSSAKVAAVKRILIVDDNTDAALLLGDILEHAGHAVAVVHDATSALARLAMDTFDVAVLDIGLPQMSGHELAVAIRSTHGDKAPRLIALTGYGAQSDRERSAAAGFAEHLTKPVDTKTLLRAISK